MIPLAPTGSGMCWIRPARQAVGMSITRRALVALAVAGSATLTGCQAAAPPPPAPPAPTAAPSTSTAPTSAAETPATEGKCTLTELKASLGRTTGEAGQRHTAIVWTNTSRAACTITGFGGVDLVGPADPMGPTYSLPRAAGAPARVELAPGGTAHTTITWLPPQDGPGWTPTGMNVTPPDETRSAHLEWPGGAVLRQDGATHPGTFISPVQAGPEG